MRKLLPKSPDQNPPPATPGLGKRKRPMVSMACESCRKRKIKCDNRRPACSQCVRSLRECRFAINETKADNETLNHQLRAASLAESSLKTILDQLRSGSQDKSVELLHSIRQEKSVDDLVKTFSDASLLLPPAPPPSDPQNSPTLPFKIPIPLSVENVSSNPWTSKDGLEAKHVLPLSQWTTLSTDDSYLTHLLNLFFAWDHTLSHAIPRSGFLQCLYAGPKEGGKFCSKFLVNSILATSHLFMSQGESSHKCEELRSSGAMFADEARRMLEGERKRPSVSLLQGLLVLWIYEINYGVKAEAQVLLEHFYSFHEALGLSDLAMPAVSHAIPNETSTLRLMEEGQVLSCIVWGVFCLEGKLSLTSSRPMRIAKPKMAKAFENAYTSIFAKPSAPEYFWSPYPRQSAPRQSFFREIISLECQLAEMIHEFSEIFAPTYSGPPASSYNETRAFYDRLLRWGTHASQRFHTNGIFPPSFLFLETTYDMMLLKVLDHLSRFPLHNDTHKSILSKRASHGASIISNLWVYRATFGLRHEFWLTQACLAATTAVIFNLSDTPSLSKSVVIACQLLYGIGEFLPVANQCLLVIKALSSPQDVAFPTSYRMIYSKLAIRMGRIIIKSVSLLDIEPGEDNPVVRRSGGSSHDVAFSSQIEGISDLAKRSS
ncbi:Amidohydro-rel domain-containing protein [Fusarium sp. LHS14.1]|nr:Amidohydro-rel domain-containing protein [Fusarium sp. LHS14.1]